MAFQDLRSLRAWAPKAKPVRFRKVQYIVVQKDPLIYYFKVCHVRPGSKSYQLVMTSHRDVMGANA